jgi:hypothetical protein
MKLCFTLEHPKYNGPAILRVGFALKDYSLCQSGGLKFGVIIENL